MVVQFRTTFVISFYHHLLWVQIPLRLGALNTTLCDQVCQWLATGLWFSPGPPISSTYKTDRHDITEILLKVALNTITLTHNFVKQYLIGLNNFWLHAIKYILWLNNYSYIWQGWKKERTRYNSNSCLANMNKIVIEYKT